MGEWWRFIFIKDIITELRGKTIIISVLKSLTRNNLLTL